MFLGKNVAPLPPLENFQIRQTMCVLIVTFSNMATNDQAIVNPPTSCRSAVWKYYGFPTKDGTIDKSKTICKICFATFKYCAGSTSSMSAHLKGQHSIDEKSEVLQSKTAKTSPGTKNSTGIGQSKIQDVMKNKLPRSGNRATAITKSIGVFIAKDMRSYSAVENKGFQHMINFLEPTIVVKSCCESCVHHFTSHLIPLFELLPVLFGKWHALVPPSPPIFNVGIVQGVFHAR